MHYSSCKCYTLTKICDNKSRKEILEIITKAINRNFESLEEIDTSLKILKISYIQIDKIASYCLIKPK